MPHVSRYAKEIIDSTFDMYPAEGLVRCLKGKYPSLPKIPKRGRVLDAGCGEGRHSRLLQTMNYQVFGFEVEESIIVALKNQIPGVEFRVGTNNKIPFEDEFFDLVISWQSLYYLATDTAGNVEDNLREISRVIKPSGVLISCVPYEDNFIYKNSTIISESNGVKYRKIFDYFGQRTGVTLASFDSPEVFMSLLSNYGLEQHEIGEMTGNWFGLSYRWFVCVSTKSQLYQRDNQNV